MPQPDRRVYQPNGPMLIPIPAGDGTWPGPDVETAETVSVDWEDVTQGAVPLYNATSKQWVPTVPTVSLPVVLDGGGAVLTTGIWGDVEIPFACTITAVRMAADQVGSVVVDIWKDSYANFPPDNADSITASAPPTITSDDQSEDTTLTGWTTAIAAGDWLRFNVDSVTSIQRVTLSLTLQRT